MQNSQEVANRIKSYAKSKKIILGKMLSDCGLSKNALSSMQSGGYLPRLENILKLADYLGCSVDYLLGRTDIPEVNKGNTQKIIQLTEEYIANLQQEQSLESNVTGAAASSTKKIHPKELAFEDLINIDTDDLD